MPGTEVGPTTQVEGPEQTGVVGVRGGVSPPAVQVGGAWAGGRQRKPEGGLTPVLFLEMSCCEAVMCVPGV